MIRAATSSQIFHQHDDWMRREAEEHTIPTLWRRHPVANHSFSVATSEAYHSFYSVYQLLDNTPTWICTPSFARPGFVRIRPRVTSKEMHR
eukprot:3558095-Pyramimonas_sp.AAC.1